VLPLQNEAAMQNAQLLPRVQKCRSQRMGQAPRWGVESNRRKGAKEGSHTTLCHAQGKARKTPKKTL